MPETTLHIPMPGEKIPGLGIIIASVFYGDDSEHEQNFTVICLNDRPPFYSVRLVYQPEASSVWVTDMVENHRNIVPAVECYRQWGGDY